MEPQLLEMNQEGVLLDGVAGGDSRDALWLAGLAIDQATPSNEGDVLAKVGGQAVWTDPDTLISGTYVDAVGDTMTGDLVMDGADVVPAEDGIGNLGRGGAKWAGVLATAVVATTLAGALVTVDQPNVTTMDALALPWGQVTGPPTTLGGYGITDAASDAELAAHTGLTNNPHAVTAAQLGLGSVENTALSTWAGSGNITVLGTLTSGGVPASLVTAGAFAAGAYTFPSTLAVTGVSQFYSLARARPTNTGDAAFAIRLSTGDTVDRWVIDGTGKLQWGTGAAAWDTNLYRPSANILKTDSGLQAASFTSNGGVIVGVNVTVPSGKLDFSAQSSPRIIMGTAGLLFRDDTDVGTRASISDNGTLSLLGDLVFLTSAKSIRTTTSDGFDDEHVKITGAGSPSLTRGAVILLAGNDDTTYYGGIQISAGSVSGAGKGDVELSTAGAIRTRWNHDGTVDFLTSGASTFTGTISVPTGGISLGASGSITTLGTAFHRALPAAPGSWAFVASATADANMRFTLLANGLLGWGDGTSSYDVTLARGAANRLDLGSGDTLQVPGGLAEIGGISNLSGDIVYSGVRTVRPATSDGADNVRLLVAGGGAVSDSRGGYLSLNGNEYSTEGGAIILQPGSSARYARLGGALALNLLTADPSSIAGVAHLFAKDVSASTELFVRDEAGNVTQISPHDTEGFWYLNSFSSRRGLEVTIQVEKLLNDLIETVGLDRSKYILETAVAVA